MTYRRNHRATPPAGPDTDKAAMLGERWRENRDHLDAIIRRAPASREDWADIDRKADALVEESFALERRLARTPADSLAGIATKLRIARFLLLDFTGKDSIETRLLASALRDLGRLGTRAA